MSRYPLLRRALEEGRIGQGHGLPDPAKRGLRGRLAAPMVRPGMHVVHVGPDREVPGWPAPTKMSLVVESRQLRSGLFTGHYRIDYGEDGCATYAPDTLVRVDVSGWMTRLTYPG